MFNLKYIIGTLDNQENYSFFYDNDEDVYRFDYASGLMYGVSNNIKNWKNNYSNGKKENYS